METVFELHDLQGKSHPDLIVTYQEDWSAMRSSRSGREVLAWSVGNKKTLGSYTTELFVNDHGVLCGVCNCPARLICKHILHCMNERKEGTTDVQS